MVPTRGRECAPVSSLTLPWWPRERSKKHRVGGGKEAATAVVARARGGWERPSKVGRRREREEMSTYK